MSGPRVVLGVPGADAAASQAVEREGLTVVATAAHAGMLKRQVAAVRPDVVLLHATLPHADGALVASFVLLGFVGAAWLPWAWLGRRAERRELLLARQVAQMLLLIAGAAAAGLPPLRILREVLPRAVQPPLADPLDAALRRADPRRGLATTGFAEILADLDARLESPAFSLARAALEEHAAEGADLSTSLEMIATLARLDLAFRLQVRATFATVRGTALLVVAFPLVTTVLLHLLDPAMVTAAYSSPVGWIVAGLVAGGSVGTYRLATWHQRRAARGAVGRAV